MSDPQRHDIFENENGARVAVRQVFPPNALGISYVEYKNLVDSNLRFLPIAEFMEQFKWVKNFGSTDTFTMTNSLGGSNDLSDASDPESKRDQEGDASSAVKPDEAAGVVAEEVRSAKPTRAE